MNQLQSLKIIHSYRKVCQSKHSKLINKRHTDGDIQKSDHKFPEGHKIRYVDTRGYVTIHCFCWVSRSFAGDKRDSW